MKMLEAIFELFVPLVMSAIIDTGIANEDVGYILKMCGVLIALGLIGLACSITAQYFAAKAAVGFAARLRHALFAHIQSLSYTEMDTEGTSTLITRMTSDINQLQNGVNMTLRLLMRSPFVVFGAMIMAFTIDKKGAMIFVIVIPVLSVIVFGIMLSTIPLYQNVQKGLDKVLGTTRENLNGVRVIRAFNREKAEVETFGEENQRLTQMQMTVGRISALMNPMTYIVVNVGLLLLLRRGGRGVNLGELTQGQVVALVNYMSQILVELVKLANLIILITKALACATRIENVMKMESSLTDPGKTEENAPVISRGSVAFDHVSLTYKKAGAESVSDVTFQAGPGETIGVIGGTGSGKSTLVNLIPRFYDATAGTVSIDGKNVKEISLEELRQKVSVVPQKAQLFMGTIRSNLQWGKEDATEEEMWQALTVAQAKEFVEKKEKGLDEEVAQNGKNFSGGQKQRLTIARALVRKPEILILDDSASALDFATDAALRHAIRTMPHAPTTFIVSQRASSIRYADQIIVLDDGRVAGIGKHEELMKTCQVYREIYESQYEKQSIHTENPAADGRETVMTEEGGEMA
jgi:ABC-type multidrug transport system fused ATPase/permease subunit